MPVSLQYNTTQYNKFISTVKKDYTINNLYTCLENRNSTGYLNEITKLN